MSDLEEENRHHSDWLTSAEWNEDQKGSFLNRSAEAFAQARKAYDAIQIPGELNTRVRAAIESEQKHRKHRCVRLVSAGAAVMLGICCIIFQQKSKQNMEYTNPSRNVIVQPESKEDFNILQTSFEAVSETESETETLTEKAAEKVRERSFKSKKREN